MAKHRVCRPHDDTVRSRAAKTSKAKRAVTFAAAYTVPTAKDVPSKEILKLIKSISIPLSDSEIRGRMEKLVSADIERPIDVAFRSQADKQKNPVHTLVQRLAAGQKQQEAARDLARRLAASMDQRSQRGLLVVAVSKVPDGRVGVHVWKFPTDDAFGVADEQGGAVLRVLKNAFASGSAHVKGATFDGKPGPTTAYWLGQVEDAQVKLADNRPSAFWTDDFLEVRLRTTSRQGTQAVVGALKDVLKELSDRKIQVGVGQVPLLLHNWAGQEKSVSDIAELLPKSTRERFIDRVSELGYGETTKFEVDAQVLRSSAEFQTWRFESGVVVTVPVGQSKKFIRESTDGDQLIVEVRGKAKSTLRSKA